MRGLIRQSLRILQLPIQVNSEALAARALSRFLRLRSIRYEDSFTWTRLELNLWKDDGTASDHFRHAVRAILAADPTNAASLSTKYFELHEQLRSEHGLNHDQSTAFLSHLNFAVTLAHEHRFTGARLTRVLSEVDTRVRFSRQSVSQAVSALVLAVNYRSMRPTRGMGVSRASSLRMLIILPVQGSPGKPRRTWALTATSDSCC